MVTVWPGVAGLGEAVRLVVVDAFTISVTGADVLGLSAVSPPYTAVRLWLPTARLAVVVVALPLLSVAVPIGFVPSRKVTVPVALEGVTVAVRVTVCPTAAGFGDAARDVEVAVCPTFRVTVGEVLGLLLASPL